jgi:outer membrane protein
MKRFMTALFCILASTSITLAQAPVAHPPVPTIVTLSFSAAVVQTAEARRELGTLQTKFAPRQAKLKELNDEIEALRKQLQSTADKLSDAEQVARQQALGAKEKQLQREAEDFRNDSDSDSQQVFQGVAQKVYAFLQTYADQHGYDLVLDRGSEAAPVVWYAAAKLDITEELIKAYNAQPVSPIAPPSSLPAPQKRPSMNSPKPH